MLQVEGGEVEVVGFLVDFTDELKELGILWICFEEGLQDGEGFLALTIRLEIDGIVELIAAGGFRIGACRHGEQGGQNEDETVEMDAVIFFIFHGRHLSFILCGGNVEKTL